ncbi:MAG: TIR domain-containing protein, partial [Lachnospiraceae bacterium]|nr:TIR domain-containing protein [Lachnospiraceae bacterium]
MSDVFISHSSKDKETADKVVKYLEGRGLSCWTAPRDIVPGTEWAAAINTAITASKVFLIIYTANSAESGQVAREVSLAENRPGVFVVPYKTDDTPLKGSFEYYLTGSHFIAANYAKKDYKFEELYNIIAEKVNKNINNITNNTHIDCINIEITPDKDEASGKNRKPLIIGLSVAAVGIIAAVLIVVLSSGKNANNTDSKSNNSVTTYDKIPSSTETIAESPISDEDFSETPDSTDTPTSGEAPAETSNTDPTSTDAPVVTEDPTASSTDGSTETPTSTEDSTGTSSPTEAPTNTEAPTSVKNLTEAPTDTPEPTETIPETVYDENDAKTQLMMYISKYGNHFENENGEYYSMKHSFGAFTIDDGSDTQRTIENSMIYLNSRYNTSENSDRPLELGIYNKDLHLHVWLKYNIKTDSY